MGTTKNLVSELKAIRIKEEPEAKVENVLECCGCDDHCGCDDDCGCDDRCGCEDRPK